MEDTNNTSMQQLKAKGGSVESHENFVWGSAKICPKRAGWVMDGENADFYH